MSKNVVVRRRAATAHRADPGGVKATVISAPREDTGMSRQVETVDAFSGFVVSAGNGALLIPTPYNVARLFQLRDQSNMLAQCIEAYVVNIVMPGWEVEEAYRGKGKDQGEEFELQSFIDHPNVDQSLVDVLSDSVRDRETVGFGFVEVVRDALDRISLLRYAPAMYTRMTVRHPTPVRIDYTIMRGRRMSTVSEMKKFRRFVQMVGRETVWFKEFGDPRRMDSRTGIFEGDVGYVEGSDATEIWHMKLPSTEAYGVPRWINQVPSILGSREAEEVNLRYFQDNTVPPIMLMIGNGRLTSGSYQQLTRQLTEEGVGKDRQHKVLLLEAVGDGDSIDGKAGNVDLKVEKLTDSRQSDGLFSEYDQGNMSKVRSSFRLPPVIVGMSQDVNFATATTSVFVAESQVFAPERSLLDGAMQRLLVSGPRGLGLTTVKLVSRTPSITSPEMVVKTLTALNVMGALTPRTAQSTANKMLQLEVGSYPEKGEDGYEEWMDKPILITTGNKDTHAAQNTKSDAVKTTEATGMVGPTQPKNGQQ